MSRGPLFVVGLLALSSWATADSADTAHLMTFGPNASLSKGDDDFREEIVIRIPQRREGPLSLRIFDPDVGGSEDEPNGNWSTRTRFSLYGGVDADSKRLASGEFGKDDGLDGHWLTLGTLAADEGQRLGGDRVFKLVVEGLEGDDGNSYDVAVTGDPDGTDSVPGVRLLDFRPTFSVPPAAGRFAEARIRIEPNTTALRVRAFDLDRARTQIELPFMEPLRFPDPGDGRWGSESIAVPSGLGDAFAAVTLRAARGVSNNAAFEVLDQAGKAVAVELPLRLLPVGSPPSPRMTYAFLPDCKSVAFDASRSQAQGHAIIGYRWDYGDGQTGDGKAATHRYEHPGTYSVQLTVKDDSGRVLDAARRSDVVKVNAAPRADPGPKRVAAPGERIGFDGKGSSDQDGRLTDYLWDFGDKARSRGPTASHAYAESGRYQVSLTVTDDGPGTCTQATTATEVWVNAAPIPDAGEAQRAAVGQEVVLDAAASRDPDGVIQRYLWDFGDGARGDGASVRHLYSAPGDYQVTLSVEDDAGVGNSRSSTQTRVIINAPPVPLAKGPERGAVGQILHFDGSGSTDSDGKIAVYHWDFGDGAEASGVEVEHSYGSPGRYEARLSVRDDSGTSSDLAQTSIQVVINAPPVADAGPDQWVTASEVHFDAGGSRDSDGKVVRWQWDFGDGSEGEGQRVTHVYPAPGTYPVTLTVTDDSGTLSATSEKQVQVRVNARPVADAGPDRLVEPGQNVEFDGSDSYDKDGKVVDYRWDFGDGSSATGVAASHVFSRPGSYQVRLQVQDDSGHANALGFADAILRVNAPPKAVAGPDRVLAPGESIKLNGSGSSDPDGDSLTYRWTFNDDPQAKDGVVVSRAFAEPGIYRATLEVSDGTGAANGRAKDALGIAVNHAPVAIPGDRIDTCNTRVVLDGAGSRDADGNPLDMTWQFGDGTGSVRGVRVIHRFKGPGRYPVLLKVDDGSGVANSRSEASTEVWVRQPPVAVAEAPQVACAGDLVLFNGTKSRDPDGGRLLYDWDFGDGTKAEDASPTKIYAKGGSYQIKLRIRNDSGLKCDTAEDEIALKLIDAPVAEAGPDVTVCANAPVAFDGTASTDFDGVVNSYSWDFGDGSSGGGPTPTHVFNRPGTFPVTLTITGDEVGNCNNRNSDQLTVKVVEAPSVRVETPSQAAPGQTLSFRALSRQTEPGQRPVLAYRWDFGDGGKAEGEVAEHAFAEPGNYRVVLVADDGKGAKCSQATLESPLVVNAPPQAIAGGDAEVALGEPLVFDGSESSDPDGAVTRYQWAFGDGERAEGVRVTHSYRAPGHFEAKLSVTDNSGQSNAEAVATRTVDVHAPPSADFTLTPSVPCAGEKVRFDGAASGAKGAEIRDWNWAFGDGAVSNEQAPIHQFDDAGRYTVSLTVGDDSGLGNSVATLGKVVSVNRSPVIVLDPLPVGCPGVPMSFNASRSVDPDGQISDLSWSFGDGSEEHGAKVHHSYDAPGRYGVAVAVTDDSGSSCAASEVKLEARVNAPPVARIRIPQGVLYTGGADDAVRFDASGSEDVDGDPLIFEWDFGDGSRGRGVTLLHRYAEPGRYQVRLEARDDSGAACSLGMEERMVEVVARESSSRPRLSR